MSQRVWTLVWSMLFVCLLAVPATAQIAGQNVNMVSGTKWPGGDPFLQRQNEPSMAVSTRNPLHLLAGANDYRTVDLNLVDQLPINTLAGDAWLGVFKSFDGGRTWRSTLLPGFPQDISPFGTASPMKGFEAASDPTVRSGTNGMFYYSGIGFNRSNNLGGLFLARFIDLNNRENGDASQPNYPAPGNDPIRYLSTVQLDSGTAGQFIDKPWMAVDIPRAGAGTCSISTQQANGTTVTQSFAAGNIYVAYAMFVGGQINVRSKINFIKSSDCGATWTKPIILSQTYAINQGTAIAVDPETGYVYVAWRVFNGGSNPDSIVVAKSTDGGNTFSKAVPVISYAAYSPANPPSTPAFFDQGTSATSFRTNAVPAIAVDDSGSASVPGRVYVAWSQRGVGPNGDARIVMSTSTDGVTWPLTATPIDNGPLTDDGAGSFTRGHQVMPAMTFNQGKLMVVYYDLRLDHTVGYFSPNTLLGVFGANGCSEVDQGPNSFVPDCLGRFYLEGRNYVGDPATSVFGPYVDDAGLTQRRHTIDVMLAQSNGGSTPSFSTARVSRYDFGLPSDKESENELQQLKVNPPNLPMFSQGTVPFIGDYIDIAGQPFVPVPGSKNWAYNNPNNPALAGRVAPSPVHFASWTSNQDVVPPADGDWTKYIPITNGTSIYNGSSTQPCTVGGWEGDRNENIYESRITQGLLVSSPQNSKPLSTTVQRAFVVLLQNFTDVRRNFQVIIANQPPGSFAISGGATGGFASFQQAVPNQPALPNPLPAPVTVENVTIEPHSGAAATVFALSSVFNAPITVNVNETDASNQLISGGLSGFVVLNADGTVPPLSDPDASPASIAGVELYTPNITTPNITTPNITTPNITTPNITTPNITTPNITTPNITTPNITTPNITTTTVSNPNITTPNITTPNITTTPVSDATYSFSNNGNTTAQYHVRVVGNSNTPLQLIASQIYTTPTSYQCQLIPQQQNITLANAAVTATPLSQVGNPNITTQGTDVTIEVAPGDTAYITLRGEVDTTTMQQIVTQVAPVAVPQAVNTNSTATTPTFAAPLFIATATLPNAIANTGYSAQVQAIGGTVPYGFSIVTGSLPPGLTINSASGVISGTPTTPGTYAFTVQVHDAANPAATNFKNLSIQVIAQLGITSSTLSQAIVGIAYGPQALTATGGVAPYCWSLSANTCAVGTANVTNGFTLTAPAGTIGGIPQLMGNTQFTVYVSDSGDPGQTTSATITIPVSGPQITTATLPNGQGGSNYSATLSAIGGVGTLAWSVGPNSAPLPPGLTLNAQSGTLSGVPSAAGTYNFTVKVMDSNGNVGTRAFAVVVTVVPFAGQTTDPAGDIGGGTNADLVSGNVAISSDGIVSLSVRFAPGTFNNQTTSAAILLDTDQNPATGHPGDDSGCVDDNGLIGGDYLVTLNSAFANNQAVIYRYTGTCNHFAQLGTAPVTISADGMDTSFPLSMLTNTASDTTSGNAGSGPWNWVVTSDYSLGGNTFSGVIDVMPDVGAVASTASTQITRTVHINAIDTYILENGTTQVTEDLSNRTFNALVPNGNGGYNTFTGTGTARGTFDIPNVPQGYFYLRFGANNNRFLWTNSSNIDVGSSTSGRPNAVTATGGSLSFTLSNMSPWQNGDDVQVYVPNNAAAFTNFEFANAYTFPPAPAAGSTTYTGSFNWAGQPLIDSTQGDNVYFLKMGSVAQGGYTWSFLQNLFTNNSIVQTDNSATGVEGVLNPLPANAVFHAAANGAAFVQNIHGPGNGPQFRRTSMGVYVSPPGPDTGITEFNPAIVGLDASNGIEITQAFDAGDIPYADPFPATWARAFEYMVADGQTYTAPGATSAVGILLNSALVTTTMPSAAAPASPIVGPLLGLTINGLAASQPLTGVGTTPTISWQAASGAQNYRVQIWSLTATPQGASQVNTAFHVQTTATSIQVPPGFLNAGTTYVIDIGAYGMPVNWSTAPNRFALPLGLSRTLSDTFTP